MLDGSVDPAARLVTAPAKPGVKVPPLLLYEPKVLSSPSENPGWSGIGDRRHRRSGQVANMQHPEIERRDRVGAGEVIRYAGDADRLRGNVAEIVCGMGRLPLSAPAVVGDK